MELNVKLNYVSEIATFEDVDDIICLSNNEVLKSGNATKYC